jgi:hypothetical protein
MAISLAAGESIESLTVSRNGWIGKLTSDVADGLLPSRVRTKAHSLLAGWVTDDDLTLATTLAQIAADDALARSPRAIADSLAAAALVRVDVPVAEVASYIVTPAVRQVRVRGVPWPRWWDIDGLHTLLVELWAGQRLASSQPEHVSRQLRSIWNMPEDVLPALLANSANPFPLLPPNLFETSLTGEATQLLREFIAMGKLELGSRDKLAGYLPELNERPDLVEVVRRIRMRDDVENAIRTFAQNISPRKKDGLLADLVSWNEQLARFLPMLTGYEIELIRKPHPGTAYRDECLAAGRSYLLHSLLGENSLPPGMKAAEPAITAPLWMQDEIIGRGARISRESVGPYPVWLFTAETGLSLAAIARLSVPGQSYGLGHAVIDSKAVIRLRLPIADGDPGPAQEVSFYYSLDYVNSAWQLLHLAAVCCVRIVVLTFDGDDALQTRGSILLKLPNEMCDELTQHALTALQSLIGDDMQALLWQRAAVDPEDASRTSFHANEVAKSEELLDDAISEPPIGADPQQWAAFRDASRALARARAQQLVVPADDPRGSELAAAVGRAVENRQRLREIARTGSAPFDQRSWEHGIAAALPDDYSAFIHFFIKDDILQTVYITRENGEPAFSPILYSPVGLDSLLAAVEFWNGINISTPQWNRALQSLLAQLAELVIRPLYRELQAKHISRLFISPTPPLDLLPLHATPVVTNNDKRPLVEAVDEVAYMPTTRMMTALSARPVSSLAPSLIIAHSGRRIPGVERIEGPLDEAGILRAIYPNARLISERDAIPGIVLATMRGCRIIHVASHAHTAADRWASGLVLQGSSFNEAILSAAEVLADGDLASTDLVILNACRTGSHQSTSRIVQKLRGLEAVFLARGARAVISTLWEIDDLTALVFATLLHTSMAGGDRPGQAYRASIAYLRSQGWRKEARPEDPAHRAESLLDQVKPAWRDKMDVYVRQNSLAWSSFKITGLI